MPFIYCRSCFLGLFLPLLKWKSVWLGSCLHYCFLLYGGFYRQGLFNISTPCGLIYFASWLDWPRVGSITIFLVQDADRPHADLFFPLLLSATSIPMRVKLFRWQINLCRYKTLSFYHKFWVLSFNKETSWNILYLFYNPVILSLIAQ